MQEISAPDWVLHIMCPRGKNVSLARAGFLFRHVIIFITAMAIRLLERLADKVTIFRFLSLSLSRARLALLDMRARYRAAFTPVIRIMLSLNLSDISPRTTRRLACMHERPGGNLHRETFIPALLNVCYARLFCFPTRALN